MKKVFFFLAGYFIMLACNNKPADTTSANIDTSATTTTEPKETPQAEFASPKYTEMGKAMIEQMSKGDIDAWANNFSEDAKFRWSAGDSLSGKAAILKYWKDRRTKVIDSLTYSMDVWLPVKVNRAQRGPDTPGIWLLSWYKIDVKYKNGKNLSLWIHSDLHYNAEDKVDQYIEYLDRSPIQAAVGSNK